MSDEFHNTGAQENSSLLKDIIITLVVVSLVSGLGYLGYRKYMMTHMPPPGGMMGMGGPATVDVAEVKAREVELWNQFSGRIAAVDSAAVMPRVSGPILTVNFKSGAQVKKDDPLFTIDPGPYKAEADRQQGLVASATAQVSLAQVQFDRADALYKTKAISQSDHDTRQNDLNVARANLTSAEAALEAAQLNLGYTEVKSPITGRAGRAEVTAGNVVQAGMNAPTLTTVVSEDPVYADFDMDEATYLRYAKAAAAGDAHIPVRLGLATEDGAPHEGRIESFDNRVDPASGTVRVRAIFDNPDGALVPGLFARISVGGAAKENVLLVNDRAIGTDQDKKFVLAVDAKNMTEYREVKLGPPAEGLRVVREGLQEGDKVIISGLLMTLRPGMPVAPKVVAMDAPPPAMTQGGPPAEGKSGGEKAEEKK